MLQLLTQYQHYIYATFVTVEILRYIYSAYTTWRSNRIFIRRMNAAQELFCESYCTMLNVALFKKFTPLSDKARIAFNVVLQPDIDISEGMWTLMNTILEKAIRQRGLLHDSDESYSFPVPIDKFRVLHLGKRSDPTYPFKKSNFKFSSFDKSFNRSANDDDTVDNIDNATQQPPNTPVTMESTPVDEHPLQESSIYDGMKLSASQDGDNSAESEIVKRPRFGTPSLYNTNNFE